MADSTTPPSITPEVAKAIADALSATSLKVEEAESKFTLLNNIIGASSSLFSGLSGELEKYKISMERASSVSEQQIKQFSVLTIAVAGAKKKFTEFGDPGLFGSFEGQMNDMIDIIASGQGAIGKLSEFARDKFKTAIPEGILKSGTVAVVSYLKQVASSMAVGADNTLRLEQGYLALAARTGDLGRVMESAGPHFDNLNNLASIQRMNIVETARAAGVSEDKVIGYYMALGEVPKGLESVVSSGSEAGGNISMLAATMRLASGSGRSFKEVVDDLKVAFDNYGLVGENALKFTARMSEISSKFNIQLKDVHSALIATSAAFKGFADTGDAANKMAEGGAEILNEYVGALEKTKATGAQALDIIGTMTGRIKDMGIAQKAFLSAQTGGPGGLMGAFQIDKMLRDGDIKGVFDKVSAQLKRQLGPIVTQDEATKSQSAAAQFARQITILQQGPLGSFAKSTQDAARILEAIKSGRGGTESLKSDILPKTMDAGLDMQKKSFTELHVIGGDIARIRAIAETGALGIFQDAFTAGSGSATIDTDASGGRRSSLSAAMSSSAASGGSMTEKYGAGLGTERMESVLGESTYKAILDFKRLRGDIPKTFISTLETIKRLYEENGPKEKIDEEISSLMADIRARKEAAGKLEVGKKETELAKIGEEEDIAKKALSSLKLRGATSLTIPESTYSDLGAAPPGVSVGEAAKLASGGKYHSAESLKARHGTASSSTDVIPARVDLTVTAICDHCKQKLETKQLSGTSTPAAASR